ncbi:MAG: hypothetical protein J6X88_08805 [Bacteroidales bacterium]|nr:hypothetical protein [Bacteroidales bacterium]
MRHLTEKIMVSLACAIILTHAVVPHHHHDCGDEGGFVFETELACHCHHDDCPDGKDCGHSHHPFDMCKLAEMLSHLVLSTKDDEAAFALSLKADVHEIFDLFAQASLPASSETALSSCCHLRRPSEAVLPVQPAVGGMSLRAPPSLAV